MKQSDQEKSLGSRKALILSICTIKMIHTQNIDSITDFTALAETFSSQIC